ncbi:MAG: hypothetical protein JSV91_13475 [Phycisphaerales bacterium]|nr:MAG: hypothetical protein JSV91_13475 [Phycisphaerales bacterium]
MQRTAITATAIVLFSVAGCQSTSKTPGAKAVDTRIGTLEFVGGYPTQDTIDKAYEQLDVQRATQAYLEFMPMMSVNSIFEAHIRDYGMTAAGDGARFCLIVHHTDADREWAYDRESHIGRLDKALDEGDKRGWTVVDMKRDWRAVHPPPEAK